MAKNTLCLAVTFLIPKMIPMWEERASWKENKISGRNTLVMKKYTITHRKISKIIRYMCVKALIINYFLAAA